MGLEVVEVMAWDTAFSEGDKVIVLRPGFDVVEEDFSTGEVISTRIGDATERTDLWVVSVDVEAEDADEAIERFLHRLSCDEAEEFVDIEGDKKPKRVSLPKLRAFN